MQPDEFRQRLQDQCAAVTSRRMALARKESAYAYLTRAMELIRYGDEEISGAIRQIDNAESYIRDYGIESKALSSAIEKAREIAGKEQAKRDERIRIAREKEEREQARIRKRLERLVTNPFVGVIGETLHPLAIPNLGDCLPYITEHTIEPEDSISFAWTVLPRKPKRFGQFGSMRVIKKDADCKIRSKQGYVWLDADSQAGLLNRYIVVSCHTLDGGYEYRTGNLNYAYCPFYSAIFAGREHPSETKIAISPKTDNEVYPSNDGTPLQIRKHQATVNCFLMNGPDGTYLYLNGGYYDSCNDYPWKHSILRYCRILCRRIGIGLAVDGQWTNHKGEAIHISTPWFSLPFGRLLNGYCDGGLSWEWNGYRVRYTASAYEVVPPALRDEELESDSWYDQTLEERRLLTQITVPSTEQCCNCSYRHSDLNHYRNEAWCDECYSEHFSCCDCCNEDSPCNDMSYVESTSQDVCSDCLDRYYNRCASCGELYCTDSLNQNDECSSCESDREEREAEEVRERIEALKVSLSGNLFDFGNFVPLAMLLVNDPKPEATEAEGTPNAFQHRVLCSYGSCILAGMRAENPYFRARVPGGTGYMGIWNYIRSEWFRNQEERFYSF